VIDDAFGLILGERDLDDVLAYKTPMVAVIRDRKLGCLRMLFMTGIFFYIVVYELLMNKGYAELGIASSFLDVRFETPPSHFNCSSLLGDMYSSIDAQFNLPQDKLVPAFESCDFSDSIAPVSSFPFCNESEAYYPNEKKSCAVQYDQLETSERVSGSSFFVPTSLRSLYQYGILTKNTGGHFTMLWVPDQLTPNPLGYDVHRVSGFFFPFVTDLVMVLSHNLQVINFDLQRSSANMQGFLISYNHEYCDSLEFADSKDLFEPNKKYPHDAEMAKSIRNNNALKPRNGTGTGPKPLCLVNFNRSSECVDKRKTARRDDLNHIMKIDPDCFEDRIRVGSLFQTLDRTDDRENPDLDSLNPTRPNETYRSTGMHMQVKLSYTNEDSFILREPDIYGDDDIYFTITASAVPNSTSTITKVKDSFLPTNKIHGLNGETMSIPWLHSKRLVERRTGITFDFLPISNRVMRITAAKFMGVLTASIVLFGVASSIVDSIMLSPRLFSWRAKLYESMKYVRSKDFSDLKDARDKGEFGEKVNPRASQSVPVAAVGLQRTEGDHEKRQFEEANALALNMIELSDSVPKKISTVVHD
jgi:hypothetical protein